MRMKRFIRGFLLAATAVLLLSGSQTCYADSNSSGINVNYHSQQEIREYLNRYNIDLNAQTSFGTAPSAKAPYKAGTISDKSLKSALNTMNAVRYIAGIDANVTLDSGYVKQSQAAALLNAANNTLSHYPQRPAGMSSTLYNLGKSGAGSSNLAYTSWKTGFGYSIVNQWMNDGDSSNISCLGHRRWILNPSMTKTGFGMVTNSWGSTYSAVYAFDNVWGDTSYYGVAWPAQNMPLEYFGNSYPWSVSMGAQVDASKVKVTLVRRNDNKKWTFSYSKADGDFYVNNDGYGRTGCIIFRPRNISYAAGNRFSVTITGLAQKVTYDVNFFSAAANETTCSHTYGASQIIKKATLTANGKKQSTCTKCGHVKTTVIYKASAVSLAAKSKVCNNTTQKPKAVVKNSKGQTVDSSNYKVICNGTPKKPGIYRVTVTFKGEYSGKKTLNYTIKPKTVQIQTVRPLKTGAKITTGAGEGITGYQISYSTDGTFSNEKTQTVTVKGQEHIRNTVGKLKGKTTYYIRVRTYKTTSCDGKKKDIYSSWSKTKKITTV